jgi:hypothetical protein
VRVVFCALLNVLTDVRGWRISRVVAEARRLRLDEQDITKLQDKEVSGRCLLAMINDGSLKKVLSSSAVEALVAIVQFPPGNFKTQHLLFFSRTLVNLI